MLEGTLRLQKDTPPHVPILYFFFKKIIKNRSLEGGGSVVEGEIIAGISGHRILETSK
jgi:hypothetical protein